MMKIFLLSLCFAVAATQDCSVSYIDMFTNLRNKHVTLADFNRYYTKCYTGDKVQGFQPTCSFDEPETQAVAKFNRQGTLTTKSGKKISYNLKGVISFQALDQQRTKIYAVFTGVQPFYSDSDKFSLHVHQKGETNPSCSYTGGHYDPCGKEHSDDPKAQNRHVGDVAKVTLTPGSDTLVIDVIDTQVKLSGPLSVLGRSVTVHAGQSSARVGCATVAVTEWASGDKHPDTQISDSSEFWSN